jgi:tetratricopeptide (TPR) repeat protein
MPGDSDGLGDRSRHLCVFGPMRIHAAGRTVPVPRGDAQRLIGHLAVHSDGAQRREVLTGTLWPDSGERSRVLSDTLYRLRRHLGEPCLEVDADTVAIGSDVSVDVRAFDRLVSSRTVSDLEEAVALYGDLLPGVYDDWALEHRAARHSAVVDALRRLAAFWEQSGELEQAVAAARRLVVLEPLDESAHQTYLRLLGRLRRYGEAGEHYRALAKRLADELGVEPLTATTEIAHQLAAERDVAAAWPVDDRVSFVGRVAERAAALAAVGAVFDGRGAVLCVEGVAGIGKTRLLEEIVGSAQWRGATVSLSEVSEVPEASPLAPLARVVAPILSAPVRAQIESNLDPITLRTLSPLHADWRSAPDPEVSPDDAGRLDHALRVAGGIVASTGTVVLVIDDLHWASPSMWSHLAALVDGFTSNGGLFVAAYRRPDIESTAGWAVLQHWDRRSLATVLRLGPLELADIAEIVAGDGSDPADVLALTGGVPFYVAQWSKRGEGRDGAERAMMIRHRLEALAPRHRRALEAAAVLGESIAFRTWLLVIELSPLELGAIIDRLTADRWLRTTPSGHAFAHDLLRAAVYEQVADADRRALHGRAAEAITQLEPENSRTRAYHLDRAGLNDAAAAAYREAGQAHRAESAFPDALEAWQRALDLFPRRLRRERLALVLDYAEVCDVVGGRADQWDALAEAVDVARRLGDEPALLRALLLLGGTAVRMGEPDEGEHLLRRARTLAERLGDRRGLADAVYRRADLLIQTGQWQRGRAEFLAALDLVEPDQDRWLHGRVLRGLAISSVRMGRPSEAVHWLEEAVSGYRATGDRMNELVTSSNLLTAYYELGSWDQIVATAERIRPLARQLGDRVTYGISCQNLALAALAVGDRARASILVDDAETCWMAAQRRRLVGLALNTKGLIADDDGDHDGAMALYRAALESARAVEAATEEAYASHDLGALLLKTGRADEAIPLLRASARHWAATGNAAARAKSEASLGLAMLDIGGRHRQVAQLAESGLSLYRSGVVAGEHPQGWLWSLAQLLTRLGRRPEADEVLEAARCELVRQATSIVDPDQRRGFFERVPLNRAIMAEVEARSASTSVAMVRLARVDAPLGRTLRTDEVVEVRWTLHAADDDSIADPASRRRHRLRRLLDESARSAAAPTDDDLAAALGVSRRTILRDMAVIGGAARATTRRRARSRRAPAPAADPIP